MNKVLSVGVIAAALLAVPACSCSDDVDKAAKKRIFSPEAPPQVVASAAEKLPPEQVAEDPRISRRILGMGAAEATERLGPHKYTASVKFEWGGGPGGGVELLESRTLLAGPGGVNGDFHGTVQNSRDQGLDVMRVGGRVYARSRYGKYRQRLRDRGMAERERDEIFGALRDFDELYEGRMKLAPQGTVAHEGRTAWRYAVSLASGESKEQGPRLPARPEPKSGIDPSTQRRLAFFEHREPTSLTGEVLVDAETSVVLKAKLEGRITVPGGEKEKPAVVRTLLDASITAIGTNPKVEAPQDFLPDEDKPPGIAAALDRFGISRNAAPDGGTRLISKPTKGTAGEADQESEQDSDNDGK